MSKVKKLTTEGLVLAYYDLQSELVVECCTPSERETHWVCITMQIVRPPNTESRNVQIEKNCRPLCSLIFEMVPAVYIWEKNNPLKIIVKKPVHKAPRRLQGMLTRMLQYDTDVYHKAKEMYIADTHPRAYLHIWNAILQSREALIQLIMECSEPTLCVPEDKLYLLKSLTRYYLYAVHRRRATFYSTKNSTRWWFSRHRRKLQLPDQLAAERRH